MSLMTDSHRARLGWSPELDEAFTTYADAGAHPGPRDNSEPRPLPRRRRRRRPRGRDLRPSAPRGGRRRRSACGRRLGRPPSTQGDSRATIVSILPRRTKLSRKVAGARARRAGARSQCRRDLPGHLAEQRAQPASPRALPRDLMGERRHAGDPAHQERPRRRRRSHVAPRSRRSHSACPCTC